MRKALIVLVALLVIFAGTWVVKAKTPADRPDSFAGGFTETAWWDVTLDRVVDDEWVIDPEIPDNYLPVPGEDELYMVIDDNGHIVKYRQRTQQADSSWLWADVNPDIPDNYEAVDGLENVYRVTSEDGTVKYYRYIRNEDDTFAFVEVDENGNDIEISIPKADEVPENYAHISGNTYAVCNEHGVIIGYMERISNEDGTYTWKPIEKPRELNGNQGNEASVGTGGGWTWDITDLGLPDVSLPDVSLENPITTTPENPIGQPMENGVTKEYQSDGTYTEKETFLTTETEGGWVTTYQTTVTRIYDAEGNLISTAKEGPTELSKTQVTNPETGQTPDKTKVENTLRAEVARMSAGANFKTDLAQSVLAALNAERVANGQPALKMSSGDAMMLAKARAAAMAAFDYSDYNSPLYGTLTDMMSKHGISSAAPSENTWRATATKTADAIHARFMSLSGSKEACLSAEYTNVGIAIVQKGAYYYICEVFIN